jgi:hypothetical protein
MQLFRPPVLRFFLLGQLWYWGMVLVASALLPSALTANYGLSFFEDNAISAAPYCIGLLMYSYYSARSGYALMSAPRRLWPVALGAYLFAILMFGILLTPHIFGQQISLIHVALGNLLFGSQLLVAIYAATVLQRNLVNVCLVLVEISGAGLALLSLLRYIPWLLECQALCELAFGILIIRVLWHQLGPNTEAAVPAVSVEPPSPPTATRPAS